jgi:UDP-N-acetyl-D-mannosaminuronate dehydrogenase
MRITVVGMGKIGLPLAVQYARKGHTVYGTDINPKTVEFINAAVEPFPGEANLNKYLKEAVSNKSLSATTETRDWQKRPGPAPIPQRMCQHI